MPSFSDGNVPDGCPRCGAKQTAIAYRETFQRVYPNWRRSDTLTAFSEFDRAKWVCTNCGAIKTDT